MATVARDKWPRLQANRPEMPAGAVKLVHGVGETWGVCRMRWEGEGMG